MNQKTKEILVKVKQHIKDKQYQQALDECQVLLMKNGKIFNAHMFSGFCYQKLNQDVKAQKAYLNAEDLDDKSIDVSKALYSLYTRLKKDNATKYLIKLVEHYKKIQDKTKYNQHFKKLIKIYQDNIDLELIHKIFEKMKQQQKQIHQDFLIVAEAHFKVSVENQCFQLSVIGEMGQNRRVDPTCKEHLDKLLLDIMGYIKKVSGDYDMKPEQMVQTISYLRNCFPDSGIILYLCLCDPYAVSHFETMDFLMSEIHALLSAFYQKNQTPYTNLNIHNPEIFTVSMLLTYEYLRFLQRFFSVNEMTQNFISKLQIQQQNLIKQPLSQANKRIISNFILKQAVDISNSIDSPNASNKLNIFRSTASKHGGFLQQVLARLAMNVFKGYKQLNDMKNILKIRITNEPCNVFLLKYYYDYLIKIGKIFRVFDQEISIDNILQSIILLDPNDIKYQIQQAWINFSRLVNQQIQEGIQDILIKLIKIQTQNKFESKELAVLKKKILIIQVHLKKNSNILEFLEQILKLDPLNYKTLITLGSYLISQQKYSQALPYLKRAFIIYQNDYHLNRFIYMSFMKTGKTNEAEYFTQRIYPGFTSAFWTNHAYAIASINRRSYDLGQKYLTKAIQIFVSNKQRQYLVSYQKIHERQDLSSPYLILQNKYKILDQYLIIPEALTESICPLISNHYYKRNNIQLKKLRMWLQMGQTLKILGRLSSSLKSLSDANKMCQQILKQNSSEQQIFTIILVKKQLASIEFYYRNFRDAEAILTSAMDLHNKYNLNNKNNIEAEIYGLYFEISIQRLLAIMRSQSSETISSYIKSFKIPKTNYTSMSYMKSLYQLKILCYFHSKSGGQQCLEALNNFLNSFNLDFNKIESKQFSNIYYSLSIDNKKLVQQAIQDLAVFGYISNKLHRNTLLKLQKEQLLTLLQLFPNNLILYILYGIMIKDVKSKVGAFLKCIQIDPHNPISLYFLANLYLEQEKYLPAIQLYLKGIQNNPLDMKSYYGLSLCLLNMAIKGFHNINQNIIRQCFDKVHSFLQYIKTIDSTVEYHFIDFVKNLFYQKNLTEFQKKIKLQNGLKSYNQLNQTDQVIKNSLFDQLIKDIFNKNIWKKEGQKELIEGFTKKYSDGQLNNIQHIIDKKVKDLSQNMNNTGDNIKNTQPLLEQIILILSLSLKSTTKQQSLDKIIQLIQKVKQNIVKTTDNINKQLLSIKQLFFRLSTLLPIQSKQQYIKQIDVLLPDIQIWDLVLEDALKTGQHAYKRKLNYLVMKYPSNQFLKFKLQGLLLIKSNSPILKPTTLSKQRLLSTDNKSHGYQKLMLYYNDHCSWILYIRQNFNKNTTQKRLLYWMKHLQANPILSDKTHPMYSQSLQLYSEIYAKYQIKYGKQDKHYQYIQSNTELLDNYNKLSAEFSLYTHIKAGNLQKVLKQSNHPLKIGLNYLYQIVTRNKITPQILQAFRSMSDQIMESQYSKYFNLLWYICSLNAQRNADMPAFDRLSALGQSTQKLQVLTNPDQYFIHISKSQLDSQPDKTDELLTQLSAYSLNSIDSKKLACYFDLMLVYGKVQSHPQDEDVFQSFQLYLNHTKQLGDVNLNSFLHYLNGLVHLRTNRGLFMLTPEETSLNEFRRSILLNPANGRMIMEKFK